MQPVGLLRNWFELNLPRRFRRHGLYGYWTFEIHDKDGVLVSTRKIPCHSYVKNMMIFLYNCMYTPGGVGMTDASGNGQTLCPEGGNGSNNPEYILAAQAGSGNASYGIVVGTGTTAVASNQTALVTKIATGTSSGQLSYGSMSFGTIQTTGTASKFTMARMFTNSSGASITMSEIALYVLCDNTSSAACYFMILRDLITETINNNASLTATLTLQYSC